MDPQANDRCVKVDDLIGNLLDGKDGSAMAVAREAVRAADDEWYGRFVAVTYESVVGTTDPDMVVPAGAAIELLRGYCRLRCELLGDIAADPGRSPSWDPTTALLAGDYLSTSAYAALGSPDHVALGDCFRALTAAIEGITDAFYAEHAQASADPNRPLPDRLAGSLGACAAVIGATLAGVDADRHDAIAEFGEGLAAARLLQSALDPDATGFPHVRFEAEDRRLRQRAQRRRADAELAVRKLPTSVDSTVLRTFHETSLS
ncbi:polyprenyl synthetase family protein [Halostella salina]|uniref:hypothetical protein n=1 Tax=Halostella salina TaxID=1547897 RepID=UPI000EF832DB|nr:hypothetical protein [Halostella salina]